MSEKANSRDVRGGERFAIRARLSTGGILRRLSGYVVSLLQRVGPSGEIVLLGTALLVGLGTGLGAVAFRYLIRGVEWVGFSWIPRQLPVWDSAHTILVPTIGGLLVGLLIFFFAQEAKGHGVPEVMEAVALRGGRIRPVVAVVKSLASSINIGTGGSVGREGPIAQIGAALGSTVGQVFRLSDERIRNLVACGAAAGIAATFNAPIAGVLFSLEIILGEFSVRYFSTVVIAAVAGSAVGQAVFGNVSAFPVPEYRIVSFLEFGLYPLLGLAAALVGVVFVRALYWSEDRFDGWRAAPAWLKPAVGGALIGVLGLTYPSFTGLPLRGMPPFFNVGYDVIERALTNQLSLSIVLILLALKLAATCLTLGSGGSGGIFAPGLFMGAMLGTGFGLLANTVMPGITAPPGAYALVGMAAVFAASAHAPITAVLILFELTGDYRIILPLMLTVVVATVVSRRLLRGESIYTLKLSRRGVRLSSGQDVDIMQSVTADDVMRADVETVPTDMSLVELSEILAASHQNGFPVLDEHQNLWGIVTVTDLDRAVAEGLPRRTPVTDIGTRREQLVVAHPGETMGDALRRMGTRGLGHLPVVRPEAPERLVGLLRRHDIIRAYNIAVTRRAELQHRIKRMKDQNLDGTTFVDVELRPGDAAVGRTVQGLAQDLPAECVLMAVRRDGRILIPHGTTVLQAGDHVTAFTAEGEKASVERCLSGADPFP